MRTQLRSALGLSFWVLFVSILLAACKQSTDTPVTPTPTKPVTEQPEPLTSVAKEKTGNQSVSQAEYEKIPLYVPASKKGGRAANVASVDLSVDMPAVGDQGSQGSCVGWATAYAFRSYLNYAETKQTYTDGAMFSPSFIYNQINGGKDEGSKITNALNLMVTQGVCTLKDMPYKSGNRDYLIQPTEEQKQKALTYKLAAWGRTVIRTDYLQECLSQKLPVIVSLKVISDLVQPTQKISGEFILNKNDEPVSLSGHAMVLVGYDDTRQAFKLMNSWGKAWGNSGYIWLSYSVVSQLVTNAYVGLSSAVLKSFVVIDPAAITNVSGQWTERAALPDAKRERANSFVIQDRVYVIGGSSMTQTTSTALSSMWMYDPGVNTWTKRADVPKGYVCYNNRAIFTIGQKAYVNLTDSYGDNPTLFEYDATNDSWREKNRFSNAKDFSYAIGFSYTGKGYLGFNSFGGTTWPQAKVLWEYDPQKDTWSKKAELPFDVQAIISAYGVIGDNLYILVNGGGVPQKNGEKIIYAYNLATNVWTRKASFIDALKTSDFVSFVLNNKLYCGLGSMFGYTQINGSDTSYPNLFYVYDPANDVWEISKPFPGPGPGRLYGVGVAIADRAFVGLGYSYPPYTTDLKNKVLYGDWWEFKP